MPQVSQRVMKVPESPIRKLVPLADEAKGRGVEVIHLNIGDPDISMPHVFTRRLREWEGGIPYAHSQGDLELLEALVGYLKQFGYRFIEKQHIQVSVGGSEALSMAMAATCEPGEEVVVFEPFFTGYAGVAASLGVHLKPVATSIQSGFRLPERRVIEAAMSEKTRAILLTNPNNPTGTVATREEVELLIEIARERDVFLLADEVYREFTFDSREMVSLLDYMPENPERLVVVDSLSKRYSAPGLRLGMIVSLHQDLMAGALRMAMARLSAGYIDQKVAAQLARVSQEDILAVKDEYERRREVIYEGLRVIPGVTIHKPEGAFYTVVGLPVDDAEAFVKWMLTDFAHNNQSVMLAPMSGFYATQGKGKNEVRIAFVVGVEKLRRAVELITRGLKHYRGVEAAIVSQ